MLYCMNYLNKYYISFKLHRNARGWNTILSSILKEHNAVPSKFCSVIVSVTYVANSGYPIINSFMYALRHEQMHSWKARVELNSIYQTILSFNFHILC